MVSSFSGSSATVTHGKIYYGWVIVAIGTITMLISFGIIYSFSVFFKPLAAYFNADRATISAVYSLFMLLRGAASIAIGWLTDRYGPVKLTVLCGLLTGLGLILTSQVSALWQLYLTYGLIVAVGLSGPWAIAAAITTRWFDKNRGMALGIVSSGSGLGTLILVPTAERLINAFNWSTAFVIFGSVAGVFMVTTAFLLRLPPKKVPYQNDNAQKSTSTTAVGSEEKKSNIMQSDITFSTALHSKKLWIMAAVFFPFLFCVQMIMAHLVNYATDIGISSLTAASFVSAVGIVSIVGRVLMGISFDRIGGNNSMMLCSIFLTVSLVWLFFVKTVWAFYLFAILFGLAYGGEVPLAPMLVGQFFGMRAMAALVGLLTFWAGVGGALGPLTGGKIFDVTNSYQTAFVVAAAAGLGALIMALLLKKASQSSE